MLLARNAMTKDVIWIRPQTPAIDALNLLKEFNIRHLPVLDSDLHIVGIVSEGDILLNCQASKKQCIEISSDILVQDIMTTDVITCYPSTPLADVAATMIACKIDCLPVVIDQKMIGIISTTDILDLYCVNEEMNGHPVMPMNFKEHDTLQRLSG